MPVEVHKQDSSVPAAGDFPTTHWSVVLAAGDSSLPGALEALEKLCRAYWYPLYVYVRRRGYNAHDAQDLTQDFFFHLLERKYLKRADGERGRFRTFLLTDLKFFLANEWDRAQDAEKRGGKQILISLDDQDAEDRYLREPVSDAAPEKIFERRWALSLLEQALEKLRKEYAAARKMMQFDELKVFLSGDTGDGDYSAPAAKLGMTVESVAVAVHRLRQRYRGVVRAEIAHTVANPAEAESEMRHLFDALAG